jgi:superoxide reductase
MDKRQFIRVSMAGAAGALFVPGQLYAGLVEPALKTRLAGGVYHTAEALGRWNQGVANHHLPRLARQGDRLQVTTPHPMIPYEHYIIKHQLLDANFGYLAERLYNPETDSKPETTFDIGGQQGVIYVLTVCNIHDMWINATEV